MRLCCIAFLSISCAAIAGAACSSNDSPSATPNDGGAEEASVDATPPSDGGSDVAVDAALDCTKDVLFDGLPKHLTCTDFFTADKKPYTPGFVFWSDGAEKQRWVVLPAGAKIDITNFDEWIFPEGIELWKEFAIEGKKIETRLYKKMPLGWQHTTYRWNDAQTEAERKDTGETVALANRTPFEIPSTSQCNYCHAAHDEPVLGFDAVSLGVASAQGVTLATLAADGRFSAAPPTTTLTVPDDTTGKAAAAMGWLHANCGNCHVDHIGAGGVGSSFRMRLTAAQLTTATSAKDLPAYVTGYCKPSERLNPNAPGYYNYIQGKDKSASLASILANARAAPGQESVLNQMPPVITHVIDATGVGLLDAWIDALDTCPP